MLKKDYEAHCLTFLTPNTAATYIKFYKSQIKTLKKQKELPQVIETIHKMDLKTSTKNTYIAALNHYCLFLDPNHKGYPKIKVEGDDKQIPAWYGVLEQIIHTIEKQSAQGDPIADALHILVRTGLRYGSDTQAIDFTAIDWDNITQNTIKVLSKGNKYKWVLLPPNWQKLCLNELKSVKKKDLVKRLNDIVASFGIKDELTIHKTRYFFANYNRQIGLSRDEIMQIGGWSSDAVDVYLFQDVESFRELAEFQFYNSVEQLDHLDAKGQAEHYKKLYIMARKKVIALEGKLKDISK